MWVIAKIARLFLVFSSSMLCDGLLCFFFSACVCVVCGFMRAIFSSYFICLVLLVCFFFFSIPLFFLFVYVMLTMKDRENVSVCVFVFVWLFIC